MKRKLIYTIIFISIFLMSSASMVTPVYGWEPPDIPAEAKGMTIDDAEVTIHDEDGLEDALGGGFDINDIKAGDADIVGARSQYKILDWETDEDLIDYEDDFSLGPNFEDGNNDVAALLPTFTLNKSALEFITSGAVSYGPYGPLAFILNYSVTNATTWGNGVQQTVASAILAEANAAISQIQLGIKTWTELMALYGESYDGTILEREVWDYLDPAEEFDPDDPDTDDDEVPFLLDPRDWRSSYDNMNLIKADIFGRLNAIQQWWGSQATGWYGDLLTQTGLAGFNFEAYEAINATIVEQIFAIPLTNTVSVALPGGRGALTTMPLAYLLNSSIPQLGVNISELAGYDAFGLPPLTGIGEYDVDYVLGIYGFVDGVIETVRNTFNALIPDKAGYLLNTLEAGQPCCGPATDFIVKVLDEFNINDEVLWKIPWIEHGEDLNLDGAVNEMPIGTMSPNTGADLGGETIYIYAYAEFSVDAAGTVTVEIEYQDDQLDPKDVLEGDSDPAELKDWEFVFPKASDAPTQIKRGDTILWESTPIEGAIPGYEIHIIVGVSLVSVIGLIYVVMRKRKR
jgi:hypothetical protein